MTEWATRQATAAEGRREVTAATAGPAQVTSFVTAGGIRVRRTAEPFDPARIDDITRQVESRRGAVLSSGMEYPGRYSRWHVAYTDPFAEVVARGRRVTITALNDRGMVLLPAIAGAVRRAGQVEASGREITVTVPEPRGTLAEEQRSRRPTVFSVLREIIALFGCEDRHLGLCGAFGYAASARPASATWCCTSPTGCGPSTGSGAPLSCTPTSSTPGRHPRTGCPASHRPPAAPAARPPGAPRRGPAVSCRPGPRIPFCMPIFPGTRSPEAMPAWSSWPGRSSPAATCSRSCRATCSTAGAPRPPRSTSGCGG